MSRRVLGIFLVCTVLVFTACGRRSPSLDGVWEVEGKWIMEIDGNSIVDTYIESRYVTSSVEPLEGTFSAEDFTAHFGVDTPLPYNTTFEYVDSRWNEGANTWTITYTVYSEFYATFNILKDGRMELFWENTKYGRPNTVVGDFDLTENTLKLPGSGGRRYTRVS